ncbi:MAG: membrane-bound lytic murein transglycosylase MltF, partial [Cellvibrionaceae bacterium]|nr:membrane-bound lytic murein transglycosylase MltF [Cellvibrionaceae bacterium]
HSDLSQLQQSVALQQADLGANNANYGQLFPVRYGAPYLYIKQLLIYKKGSPAPKTPADLIGKTLQVEYGSHHAASLAELLPQYPDLRWQEVASTDNLNLIKAVQDERIDYAVVNSNMLDISRSLFPEVRVGFALSASQEVAWSFSQIKDNSLYHQARDFIHQAHASGQLEQLSAQHYGHIKKMDYNDAVVFYRRLQTRLPQWRQLMQDSAKANNLDWNLLAAVSYQESHWKEDARSYTGVKGLMMLTKATAKYLGVADRTDPAQSIEGGARYIKNLYQRLPPGIQGQDRTWFTLAAYNVGFGHLEDARILTQRQGGDPNRWQEVKKRLPLLAQEEFYSTLRHGYARGREPVKYVQNIRRYYDILAWQDDIEKSASAAYPQDGAITQVKLKPDDRDLTMSLL